MVACADSHYVSFVGITDVFLAVLCSSAVYLFVILIIFPVDKNYPGG